MRRILVSIGVTVVLLTVVWQTVLSQSEPMKKAAPPGGSAPRDDKARAPADRSADEAAIRASIAAFTKAYNAGDAKAVAAQFTPDGQIVDKEGNTTEGREAIAETFKELFKENPKKQL